VIRRCRTRGRCGACGGLKLKKFLNLGTVALAGAFRKPNITSAEPHYRLELGLCKQCTTVQVLQCPPIGKIFHKKYRYLSSQIPALVGHFQRFSFQIFQKTGLQPASTTILEIGCNDGVFLRPLLARGAKKVVGIDPGPALGFRHTRCFHHRVSFSRAKAGWLKRRYGQFDIVTASNVFSHLKNLRGAAEGVSQLLRPGGWFVCEVHPLFSVVRGFQYDMIYHEHLYYHTVRSLETLLSPGGLKIVDLEPVEMHAGSMRIWARKKPFVLRPSNSLLRWRRREKAAGLDKISHLNRFAQRVAVHSLKLRNMASWLARHEAPLAGFGASGRANTLLQASGLGKKTIFALADDARSKQRMISPGSHIPISSCASVARCGPRSLILLAWSYQRWILPKIKRIFKTVEKILIPLPRIRVVRVVR